MYEKNRFLFIIFLQDIFLARAFIIHPHDFFTLLIIWWYYVIITSDVDFRSQYCDFSLTYTNFIRNEESHLHSYHGLTTLVLLYINVIFVLKMITHVFYYNTKELWIIFYRMPKPLSATAVSIILYKCPGGVLTLEHLSIFFIDINKQYFRKYRKILIRQQSTLSYLYRF